MRTLICAAALLASPVLAHDALIGKWAITGTASKECMAVYYADDGAKIALTYDAQADTVDVLFTARNETGANIHNLSIGAFNDQNEIAIYNGLRFDEINFQGSTDYDLREPVSGEMLSEIKKSNKLLILSKHMIVTKYDIGPSGAAMDNLRLCAANHEYGE